jgi:hypothetical protein
MSILTHIPTQLTDDQKLTLKADGIKRSARAGFARICDIQRSGIDHLWKDRTHSPQEIIDALGASNNQVRIFWSIRDGRPFNALRAEPVPEIAYAIYTKNFETPTEHEGEVEIIY